MKRFLLFLSCLLIVLSFCSCKSPSAVPSLTPPSEQAEDPLPTGSETAKQPLPEGTSAEPESTVSAEENVAIGPALAEGPEGSLVLVLTDYFSLTLPHSWANTCVYTVTDMGNGVYCANLYEAEAYWEFGGGNLCSLLLMPTGDDTYKDFPDYQLLAALDTPEGSFYVVVLFPTDVQFIEATQQTYSTMFEELPEVLCSITPVPGVEMAMP